MKITKRDKIYHSKEKDDDKNISIGKLKKLNSKEKIDIENIIRNRIKTQIKSRIHKEFFKIKVDNDFTKTLMSFMEFLYDSENKNFDINRLIEVDIEKLIEDKNIIAKYKLKTDYYLITSPPISFIQIFNLLKEEIKTKKINSISDIKNLKSYQDLATSIQKNLDRKVEKLTKSLENNKISVTIDNNDIKLLNALPNLKDKFYIELIEKCKKDLTSNILEWEIENFFDEKLMNKIDKILKTSHNLNKNKATSLLNEIRKENLYIMPNEYDYNLIGKYLLWCELKSLVIKFYNKKYVLKTPKNSEKDYKEKIHIKYIQSRFSSQNSIKFQIIKGFKNKFINKSLEYGKYLYFYNNKHKKDNIIFTTKILETIKAEESLLVKLNTLLDFSIHTYDKLIEDFENSGEGVGNNKLATLNSNKLRYFFPTIQEENNISLALQSSIALFRNNIIHFKFKADLSNSDNLTLKIPNSINSQKKEIIKNENKHLIALFDNLKNAINKKFQSNNLEYYYSERDINKYFNLYEFTLCKKKIPFAPNFKRIIEKGEKLYQHDNKKYRYFNNFRTEKNLILEKDEILKTRYYLLKELYYSNFFNEFLDENKNLFKNAIFLAKKRKRGKFSENGESGSSYQQFDNYKKSFGIDKYVANLHKLEMAKLKEKKFDESSLKEKSKYIKEKSKYISEFLEDIFLEGFIEWLNKNELYFLAGYKLNLKDIPKKNYKIKCKTNYSREYFEKENTLYSKILFSLFLVADSKRLSEFANELVKFEQYLDKKIQPSEKKFLNIKLNLWREICELVLVSREQLNIDDFDTNIKYGSNNHFINKYYGDEEKYEKVLENFIESDVLKDKNSSSYFQTDKTTPIIHKNIEKTRKFGFNNLVNNINYSKYSLEDKNRLEKLSEEIENLQKEKLELHLEWEKNSRKFSKNDKNSEYLDKYLNKYLNINTKIREYDYLKKKETIFIPFLLHEIASDIQARFMGYIYKRERDFLYYIHTFGLYNKWKNTINIEDKEEKEKEIKKFYNIDIIKSAFDYNSYGDIRNYVAHFHHYIDSENGKEKTKFSFIEQMNILMQFLSYDKKLKNQVNKSIKTVLEKYNIGIEFKREINNNKNEYDYIIDKIDSKKGKILGKENKFSILENDFIKEVKKLLEYGGRKN